MCVKGSDYISHLPLSLTVGGHPPRGHADQQIPALVTTPTVTATTTARPT